MLAFTWLERGIRRASFFDAVAERLRRWWEEGDAERGTRSPGPVRHFGGDGVVHFVALLETHAPASAMRLRLDFVDVETGFVRWSAPPSTVSVQGRPNEWSYEFGVDWRTSVCLGLGVWTLRVDARGSPQSVVVTRFGALLPSEESQWGSVPEGDIRGRTAEAWVSLPLH
jgi:hypothetical protein